MMQQAQFIDHDHFNEGIRLLMPQGIIGFQELRHYLLKPIMHGNRPGIFWLLQSHEHKKISFILLESYALKDRINIDIKDVTISAERYGIDAQNYELFFVTNIDRSDPEKAKVSVNLKAPVIIDFSQQQAWQIILTETGYEIKYVL